MDHTHTDDDDEERFGELLRSALPPRGPVPPSYEFWAAGQARRSARHHRRVALSAAAAIVVLMAVSIPVLNRVGGGPSELTTTGTDLEATGPSSTTTSQTPAAVVPETPTPEPPGLTAPTTTPPAQAVTPQDPAERSSGEHPASVTTTTLIASGQQHGSSQQSRSGNGNGSASPVPPPPVPPSLPLSEAARAAFQEQFGGVSGYSEETYVVHVKPGRIPLPLTFQGYPVVPAAFSWTEREATLASIEAHEQELRANDLPIIRYFINLQTLEIEIVVARLDPTMEQAALDILGAGPWKLHLA